MSGSLQNRSSVFRRHPEVPEGGKIHDLTDTASAFAPDYVPEEMFEIATKLYKKAKNPWVTTGAKKPQMGFLREARLLVLE